MRAACLLLLVATGTVLADRGEHHGRHVVQPGETVEHVAAAYGCTTGAVLRKNRLKTTLVPPRTVLEIPLCSLRGRARTRDLREPAHAPGDSSAIAGAGLDDKARVALAVIDGATWIAQTGSPSAPASRPDPSASPRPAAEAEAAGARASQGAPWAGALVGGDRLPDDAGYLVRRPSRAYGASHVIEHLRAVIAVVRALYPDVHTLAIGDLSAQHGGRLDNHRSHQSGLDVDVGFYFHRVPSGYPDRFAAADSNLDLEATWALVTAFARTATRDDGVEVIFLDHTVQRRLYRWARERGTPDDDLAFLLQYPRDKDAAAGLVRHWPNHADHLHVRFKSGAR